MKKVKIYGENKGGIDMETPLRDIFKSRGGGNKQTPHTDLPIGKYIVRGVGALLVMILLMNSFYTIQAGHRGVLLTFGKPSMVAQTEGLHFKIPIAQSVKKMEVRKQKVEVTADSSSKDLQDVQTIIALNFHVSPDFAPVLYRDVGNDYNNRIIQPAIQESVKSVSATYTAEELIAKRPKVKADIKGQLTERLATYNLIVDEFNIVNFQFSAEFDKAIEAKVTAEQLKLKAEKDLERIEVEALQREAEAIGEKNAAIALAEGQKEAIRLKAEADSNAIQIVAEAEADAIKSVENTLKDSKNYVGWYKINKWDGHLPRVTSGIPFVDVSGDTE